MLSEILQSAEEFVNPKTRLHIGFLVLLAAVSTMTFMAPLCGFMFKCGCVWNWAGADSHCNIHHALPPHCPWCAHGKLGYALPMVGLTLGQFTGGLVTLRLSGKLALSGLATVLSILPVAFVLGYLTILLTSYPYFLTTH
jgi:hypothetical protein